MSNLEIDITIHEKRWKSAIDNIEQFTSMIIDKTLSDMTDAKNVEISIVLANDNFVQNLNKEYRGKDKPTNVLSFPLTEEGEIDAITDFCSIGDVVIAFETIQKEAKEQNKTFEHHYAHMLVHGCLHLLHFDHESEGDAHIMESREISILETLGIKNPYEII